MKRKPKILIVGAGPAGTFTARTLETRGLKSILIEEHRELGRPLHCTGLVGRDVFQRYRIPRRSIINQIDGAIIHHNNDSIILDRNAVAYVIDREIFDRDLGDGLDVRFQTRFIGLEKNKDGYIVETDREAFQADIVIGADGATSLLRRFVDEYSEIRLYKAFQFRIKGKPKRRNFVEVYLKKPSFFWVVPEGDQTMRVGVISENPYYELIDFLERKKLGNKILEKFGGIIPIGRCRILKEKIALVGDAACQVKPLTGGGIWYALNAAEILVSCIARNSLKNYSRIWNSRYGKKRLLELRLRNLYERLNKAEVENIFSTLVKKVDVIRDKGDFEDHSKLIRCFLKDPMILNKMGKLLLFGNLNIKGALDLYKKSSYI